MKSPRAASTAASAISVNSATRYCSSSTWRVVAASRRSTALYRTYGQRGFSVLGFPCNQFGAQEPGDAAQIGSFCSTTYDVTFPMFAKIDVNGADTHPLYKLLKSEKPGVLGTESIKWNFTKFLVDRNGNAVKRFAPKDAPSELAADIEALL
jgi:glutathione peroxidase